MFSSSSKPYTAVTVQVNRMTSEKYANDDLSGIPDLIEVIRIQPGGSSEAARAIRKKLKYGSVDQQLRALTILDSLIENAGPRFQRSFADEPLLERLRVCATDGISDPEVKNKCQILFRQWASAYTSTPGMERVVALQKQLPKRKKPVTQQNSKVLKESEPGPNEDPFGSADDDLANSPNVSSPTRDTFASSSSRQTVPYSGQASFLTSVKEPKKSKLDKNNKKKHRGFNLEKEKPQILQAIASATMASTNLMNALKLIDRERKRVSEDAETVLRFENCKQLRRQILRYIQHIESEQWLGSLINANDTLVDALMAYEILDKSVENDSDSDGVDWPDEAREANLQFRSRGPSVTQDFAGLTLESKRKESHPSMTLANNKKVYPDEDSDAASIDEDGDYDDDNPFADSNALHTPKGERPGMTWKEV